MGFRVSRDDGAGCIRITYTGELCSGELSSSIHEACLLAVEAGGEIRNRFMCDLRDARNPMSALSVYDWVHSMRSKAWSDRWQLALVTAAGDLSHDFLETVALNAGYCVRMFAHEDHAAEWLATSG